MKFDIFSPRTGSSVLTHKHKHSLCKATILSCLFCFGGFSFASAAETWQFPKTYTADDGVVYNRAFAVKDSSDNLAYYVSEDQTKYAIITFDSDYTSALSCTVYDNGTVLKGTANLSNSSSVVISGYVNEASGEASAIIGGSSNKVTSGQAVVVGGVGNDANGLQSVTMGGSNNHTSNSQSVVVGGTTNIANGIQSVVLGGFSNATTGPTTVIVGGHYNKIDGNSNASAVIVGGNYNYLSNSSCGSAIFGGKYNRSVGSFSYLVGGYENIGNGSYSLVAGGTRNAALSFWSSVFGGTDHVVDNSYGVAVGGQGSVVFGNWTTGIGGGSVGYKNETTGEYIGHATAIGHGAVTASDYGLSLGYQSTQDESGTISFGHDAGDISGYTVNWVKDSDGNIDYTSFPTYTENTYTSAYYNRLVKVADGIDDHDVATVEQLISSGSLDKDNQKLVLSSKTGTDIDIDFSSILGDDGKVAIYSAGDGIEISDNYVISLKPTHVWGSKNGVFALDDTEHSTNLTTADWVIGEGNFTDNSSNSILLGKSNSSYSSDSIIIGINSSSGNTSDAYGRLSQNTLIGFSNTISVGSNSVAVGANNHIWSVSGDYTPGTTVLNFAVGCNNSISGDLNSVFGSNNTLLGIQRGIAIGDHNAFNSNYNIAIGFNNMDTYNDTPYITAIGYSNSAIAESNYIFGRSNHSLVKSAITIGVENSVVNGSDTDSRSSIIGWNNQTVFALDSVVMGNDNRFSPFWEDEAVAKNSLVLGNKNLTNNAQTIMLGSNNYSQGKSSTILGNSSWVTESSNNTLLLGNNNAVTVADATAIGNYSVNHESNTISFGHSTGEWKGYYLDANGNATYLEKTYDSSSKTSTDNTKATFDYDLLPRLTHIGNGVNANDASTVSQLISSGTFDAKNKKITLSSDVGKTVDIDLSKLITTGGTVYSAGTHISITDNVLDTVGLIAYDSSDMASAKLGGTNGTKLTNLKQATLSKVSTDAVTGSQLYATNLSISGFAADIKKNASDLAALSSSIADQQASVLTTTSLVQTLSDGRTDLSLSNINSSGESKIKYLAKEVLDDYFANSAANASIGEQVIATMELSPTVSNQIAIVDESGTTATTDYVDQAVADKVSQSQLAEKLAIKADISYVDNSVADKVSKTELATELAKKADVSYVNDALAAKADLSYVDEALTKKADVSYVSEKLESKVDIDGSNIDVTKFTEKLGTGEVAKDNGNLVTGGKVYEATQNVLSESKSYTDTSVSALASQVDQAMGNMYGSLSKDINQGVAKASALAALKPLEYDPEDKFNFAVGYGHYKNGNSSAIGAFYYANANTMFNVGATIGNGDTAFNAGVSFKIGHGSTYNGVSKATLVAAISNQQKQLDAQNEEIEQLKQAVLTLLQKQ